MLRVYPFVHLSLAPYLFLWFFFICIRNYQNICFFFTADGKLNLEESKIMTSKSPYDLKQIMCHFEATDTNNDLYVSAGELKKRFEYLKYDISLNGVTEFIKKGDVDELDNKFSYNGKDRIYHIGIISRKIIQLCSTLYSTTSIWIMHSSLSKRNTFSWW